MPWTGSFNDPTWLQAERALVERARQGDLQAFGELYQTFADRLFCQVLLPKLGERARAEEALAETFRAALERLPGFEPRGVSLYFWLVRIAENKAMDAHREAARAGRALTSFEALLAPLRPPPEDPGALVERRDELEQLRARVARTLERIHPRYRRALELRILEDRARADCAEALEVTVPTFDVVLLRALRAFRREWEAA